MSVNTSVFTLHRSRSEIPAAVRQALADFGLLRAFLARPARERHNYLAAITDCSSGSEQRERIADMLDELVAREGAWR